MSLYDTMTHSLAIGTKSMAILYDNWLLFPSYL